jgi:hypothetical protein
MNIVNIIEALVISGEVSLFRFLKFANTTTCNGQWYYKLYEFKRMPTKGNDARHGKPPAGWRFPVSC